MFSNSIFGEILKQLPRDLVADCGKRHASDRWSKGFKSWDHLVALMTAQLGGTTSLRELETVFNSQSRQHYHLHAGAVRRSTLSEASRSRTPLVFRDIAMAMIERGGRRQRQAREVLAILDSSTISIAGRGGEWVANGRRSPARGLTTRVSSCICSTIMAPAA